MERDPIIAFKALFELDTMLYRYPDWTPEWESITIKIWSSLSDKEQAEIKDWRTDLMNSYNDIKPIMER